MRNYHKCNYLVHCSMQLNRINWFTFSFNIDTSPATGNRGSRAHHGDRYQISQALVIIDSLIETLRLNKPSAESANSYCKITLQLSTFIRNGRDDFVYGCHSNIAERVSVFCFTCGTLYYDTGQTHHCWFDSKPRGVLDCSTVYISLSRHSIGWGWFLPLYRRATSHILPVIIAYNASLLYTLFVFISIFNIKV